jgi:iron-sulfur cluster assembly accessory protein
MNLTVTPEAVDALKQAISQRPPEEGPSVVRVVVAHQCGCGSTKFQMGFDEADADDTHIDLGGVTLVVDPFSAPSLEGARLEVVQDGNLIGPRFKIETPNGGGCGCGGGHHH